MATEFGKELMEILTLENGRTLRQMDMEFTCGRTETGTKESGRVA